jgi:hypothetical protein
METFSFNFSLATNYHMDNHQSTLNSQQNSDITPHILPQTIDDVK